MTKTQILGVNFHVVSMEKAVEVAMRFMDEGGGMKFIVTPGPEIVMAARRERSFCDTLNEADLSVPDGVGVLLASRLDKIKIRERVPGVDLVINLLAQMSKTGKTAYLLGASPGVALEAKKRMEKKYPGLRILGARDGYFKEEDIPGILDEINGLVPDLLVVGLGAPRQEKWIYNNRDKLNVRAAIGVGGGIDVMGGKVRLAPKLIRKLNIEWLYRLICQPSRFRRQLQLPLFVLAVLKNKFFKTGVY